MSPRAAVPALIAPPAVGFISWTTLIVGLSNRTVVAIALGEICVVER